MKWGSEEIGKCLDLYAVQTCLWDFNDPNFKNKNKRATALEFILREMGVDGTVEELKNKIHSIRNTYTNELRKIEKSKKSGSATDDVYVPKIPWFGIADSFLRKIVSKRKSHSNLDFGDTSQESIPCDGETNGLTQEASCSSQVDINEINNDVSSVVSTELAETVTPAKKRMKVLKKDDSLKPLEDAVQVLRTITSKKEDDELDNFMKSIVSQMRKLPEEHNIRLMSDIQSLVSERRTEHLKELKSQAVSASGSQFFINVPPNVPHESLSFFYEDSSKIID